VDDLLENLRPVSDYDAQIARAYLFSPAATRRTRSRRSRCCRRPFASAATGTISRLPDCWPGGETSGPPTRSSGSASTQLVTPAEIVIALERGKVAEAAGQREVALNLYRLVLRTWERGDPEVQTLVQDAGAGIRRLGGS
jgi:hypothetical protein